MKTIYNLTIAILIALLFLSACDKSKGNKNKTINTANSVNTASNINKIAVATPTVDPHLNVLNFAKLTNGMKYSEVVKILGSEGENIGESDLPDLKTVMYQWKNDSGAFVKIVFQNDKLVDKVHTGLR